jgi:type I restriction enzyme, S subunit
MAYIELGDICDVVKGEIGITKAVPGEYPMVTTGADRISNNKFQLDTEAVLVPLVSATGHGHASIKRIHYQEGKFAFGSILAACVPKDDKYSAKFLHIYFQLMKDYVLVPLMKGSANVSLTLGNLKTAKVPDISREVQESIVKLYSTLKIEQDEAISILSIQKKDIDTLRQAILQEAVQGKLTAKWREVNPSVENASVLLKRIEAEKQQLITEKKIKKEKPLPLIEEDEKPYELPASWVWCRLGSYCKQIVVGYVGPVKQHFVKENGIPMISTTHVGKRKFVYNDFKLLSNSFNTKQPKSRAVPGDIIIARHGDSGKNCIVPDDYKEYQVSNVVLLRPMEKLNNTQYICNSVNILKTVLQESRVGAVFQVVNTGTMMELYFPLPPLQEQQAIVEKVNSLMALCDELEQQVDNSQSQIEQLMQSCLKEVFEQESN